MGFLGTLFNKFRSVFVVVDGCGGAVITFFIGVVGSDGTDFISDFGGVVVVVGFFTGCGTGGLGSLTVDRVKPDTVGSQADLILFSPFVIGFFSFGSPLRSFVRFDNVFCCVTGSDSVPSMIRFPVDASYSDLKVGSKYFGGLFEIVLDEGYHIVSRDLDEGGA
jgi:hypothetical protein